MGGEQTRQGHRHPPRVTQQEGTGGDSAWSRSSYLSGYACPLQVKINVFLKENERKKPKWL